MPEFGRAAALALVDENRPPGVQSCKWVSSIQTGNPVMNIKELAERDPKQRRRRAGEQPPARPGPILAMCTWIR